MESNVDTSSFEDGTLHKAEFVFSTHHTICAVVFCLLHSGSTGKPKGVLHTTGGYMLYAATTFKYTFDYHDEDIYWCTADVGWITGHTYVCYGPLLNGATSVIVSTLHRILNPLLTNVNFTDLKSRKPELFKATHM